MSILEKSERIGRELKNTIEGQHALELYKMISQYPQETTFEFFQLINRYYIQAHFFSIQHALDILKDNVDNEVLGTHVRKLLSINEIHDFAAANIPIGKFVEEISKVAFGNEVKYELPKDVSFTPELVRLSNSLTVECLRTNILQRFLAEYHTKPEFIAAIQRFDELRGAQPIVPYSKEDRKILGTLKKEFGAKCEVDLLHLLVSMMSYIKDMIFDAFYDNVFEIYEETDIISRKQKALANCIYNRLILHPDMRTVGPKTGWIMKIHNLDGSVTYGQIFSKTMHWTKEECTMTVNSLAYNIL